ncbi:hypothetical protein PIB30_075086 [Stylosanthes scabra]|uniref:Uncharacterized protein n=1 Tax=Stylosanthes scabra TaxID=79078 RepID=A0ABU6WSN2_9FABA|nr:hypothetical protein [Stylosanthes scabra]
MPLYQPISFFFPSKKRVRWEVRSVLVVTIHHPLLVAICPTPELRLTHRLWLREARHFLYVSIPTMRMVAKIIWRLMKSIGAIGCEELVLGCLKIGRGWAGAYVYAYN